MFLLNIGLVAVISLIVGGTVCELYDIIKNDMDEYWQKKPRQDNKLSDNELLQWWIDNHPK
ncbi:MAG: hypothetical protein PHD05_00210 [Sphaerochaetaceae bacterium]|nr:hypothetical protein [Sphaerochaetaceae bacterium]